jgi:Holliday junction DNA helicase RuvA
MIAAISGRLATRDASRIVIETAGIGYEVLIPLSTFYRLPGTGEQVGLEIRQVVREESITLYGFSTAMEKRSFDLLMSVQHVGPKLALAILSMLAPEDLIAAIAKGDVERIDAVPGVGPKVAERVVRELRDKVGDLKLVAPAIHANGSAVAATAENAAPAGPQEEAVSALINLGMKPIEAKRAVESVIGSDNTAAGSLEVLIRKSLAVLLGEKSATGNNQRRPRCFKRGRDAAGLAPRRR